MPNTNHAPMPNRYLDDLAVGDHWDGHPIHVEQDAAVRFASQYDPQPMHIDPVAAAQGRFGGLIASGWYVAAMVMRDHVATSPWSGTQMLGIGVDELRWLHPVRPGDVLTAHREIVELKVSRSKPDRGTVRVRTSVSNQDGRAVMIFSTLIQLPTRPAPER
jgi:acyl dehydratase